MMDLAPLLCVIRAPENASSLSDQRNASRDIRNLHDPCGLPIGYIDFLIILLLLQGPLAARHKESSPGLGTLYAYISNRKQFCHRLRLFHGNLLHCFDVVDPITEGIDDLDVLNVQDSILGIAKMFHVVLEALITLLLDGLQHLCSRRTLVHALKVPDEYGT
jgi:hypothetical protein